MQYNSKTIEARLQNLEYVIKPYEAYVIVKTADGEEREVPVAEYVDNWQTMDFLRVGKNFNLKALDAVLSVALQAAYMMGDDQDETADNITA